MKAIVPYIPDLLELSPNAVGLISIQTQGSNARPGLTFYHAPYDVQTHYHACDTAQCLLPSAEEVEHVTASASHREGPAAQDDVDLRLRLSFSDAGLSEDLVQVEPVVFGQSHT